MEIESNEIQTIEDEISGEFCECGHEISEHYKGIITGISKCCALLFNGAVWHSCNCKSIRQKKFIIKVMVPEYADNPQIRTC